ncbi:MAG: hypothetical protein A2V65_04015 [Deltaproteobacteria bacterium RBG_13_49_15]|nr:MAG: hypothetical protein A2V65_04015 [Deltaproteobacteria bacterium RBG_13_49_15]
MLLLYNIFIAAGMALGGIFLFPLVLLSEKRRRTVLKRFGLGSVSKSRRGKGLNARPLWVHALSVGEVNAAIPLIKGLKKRFFDRDIVFSASTLSGFETAQRLAGRYARSLFFFPYDIRPSVSSIIEKVDPALVVLIETDLWPNFLQIMKQKNVPVILSNARISRRSHKRYMRFLPLVKGMFGALTFICASSLEDAERFVMLGIPRDRIDITGNLKYDKSYKPCLESEMNDLRKSMGIGPYSKVLVAGSTHKGEEEIIFRAFTGIKGKIADSRLVIAPRRPDRSLQILHALEQNRFSVSLVEKKEPNVKPEEIDVWVVNAMGILERMYDIADVVFIGGSLVKEGGHNPLEPAARSKPILFGPDMSDFEEAARMLLHAGGAFRVFHDESLANETVRLFLNQSLAAECGKNGYRVYCSGKGAVDKTLKILERYI